MTNTTPRTGIDEERVAGMVARAIEPHRAHIRRQVAEEIATAITEIIGGYPDNGATRPKRERGAHLNDAEWAAHIARQIGATGA